MTDGAAARDGALWAITSYFNPAHYRRRLANYRAFRGRLQVPLATIELSFDGKFELGAADADLLVQIRADDVMWQKERLLNALLPRLPAGCRQVVSVDCDLVFERDDWPARVGSALAQAALVQPFRRAHHLPADAGTLNPSAAELTADALAVAMKAGQSLDDTLGRVTDRRSGVPTPGFAWASSRGLLERHGFYDACIIGGGDTAFACAALGTYEHVMRLHYMNDRQRARYLAWAEPFHRDVRGSVAHVEGGVFHLWHGAIADRRPRERHEGLRSFNFDPGVDITLSESGCWHWASDKPGMHRYVREYFAARREDG